MKNNNKQILLTVLLSFLGALISAQPIDYCGPEPIIDKCNPNRIDFNIEIYDIKLEKVNPVDFDNYDKSGKKAKNGPSQMTYSISMINDQNYIVPVIANTTHTVNLNPNSGYIAYSPNFVVDRTNYLVKDMNTFKIGLKFTIEEEDIYFLRNVPVWKDKNVLKDFKNKRYKGSYLISLTNNKSKEFNWEIPLLKLEQCTDTILDRFKNGATQTLYITTSSINNLNNSDRVTPSQFKKYPYEYKLSYKVRVVSWKKLNNDATKEFINHPLDKEIQLCSGDFPYVLQEEGSNLYPTCKWEFPTLNISKDTLRECIYIERPSDIPNGSAEITYDCGNQTNECLNDMPITLKVIDNGDIKITPGRDTMICRGNSVSFQVPEGHQSYKWYKVFRFYQDQCGREFADKECIATNSNVLTVSEPGIYISEVISKEGCLCYDTVQVFLSSIPAARISANTLSICSSTNSPITASLDVVNPQNYASLTWSANNTNINSAGKYWVSALDLNQCPSSDTVEVVDDACDGLYDGQQGRAILTQLSLYDFLNNNQNTLTLEDVLVPNTGDIIRKGWFVNLNYHRSNKSDVLTNNFKVELSYTLNTNPSNINKIAIADFNTKMQKIYQAKNMHDNNISNITLTINSIEITDENNNSISLPQNTLKDINLELELKEYIVPNFSNATQIAPTEITYTQDLINHKLLIAWKPLKEAISYELKWAYKDAYDKLNQTEEEIMKERGISIITNENYYEIDLTYPEGQLFYTIRPIARFTQEVNNNYNHLKYGKWSAIQTLDITNTNAFQADKSWQRTLTFAEEGKKKEVVSYYDQLLRGTQVITNLNTEKLSLAAETYYDYESRPVLNILPVPLQDNNLLYKEQLNKVNGTSIQKSDFSQGIQPALDQSSGTAQYYSANNTFLNSSKYYANMQNIPDANGFVSTQVEYKRDNTGRVTKQSGVGEEFALDLLDEYGQTDKHYTQFLYGSIEPNELIRLFGSNTGQAKFYKKYFTIDPNNQISVSYNDMYGRTVATCLSGKVPDNLKELPNKIESMVTNLSNNNVYNPNNGTATIVYNFVNTITDINNRDSFIYNLHGAINQLQNDNFDICQTCEYQVEIKLKDPFGRLVELTPLEQLPSGAFLENEGKQITAIFGKGVECDLAATVYGNIVFDAPVNMRGEYTLYKELKVLTDPFDGLKVDTIPGVVSFEHFKDSLLSSYLDSTACDFGCSQYVMMYMRDSLLALDPPQILDTLNNTTHQEIYHTLYNSWCTFQGLLLSDSGKWTTTDCEGILQQMLAAVSPGGLYFTNEFLPQFVANIPEPSDEFDGASFDSIIKIKNCTDINCIQELWKPDFANFFVVYHPEYCHYIACLDDSSDRFLNLRMSTIFTWTEATSGAINYTEPQSYDPLFPTYQNKYENFYEKVIDNNVEGNPFLDLYDFVDWTNLSHDPYYNPQEILYSNIDFSGFVSNTPPNYGLSPETIKTLDTLRWFHFRDIMLALKEEAKAIALEADGCRFLPDDSAIVKYPVPNRGDLPSPKEGDSIIAAICQQNCDFFADRYLNLITQFCKEGTLLSQADTLELKNLLNNYCTDNCGLDNPLGIINPTDTGTFKTEAIRTFLDNHGYSCPWDSIIKNASPFVYQAIVDSLGDTLKVTICDYDGLEALMVYMKSNLLNYYTNDTAGNAAALQTLQQWGVDINNLVWKEDHLTFVKTQNNASCSYPCVNTFYFLDSLGNKIENIEEIVFMQSVFESPLSQGDLYQYYANQIVPYFGRIEATLIVQIQGQVPKYKRGYLYALNYSYQGSGCGLDFVGDCIEKPITIWVMDSSVLQYLEPVADSCHKEVTEAAISIITDLYQSYLDSIKLALYKAYIDNCFNFEESFIMKYKLNEYQYTLYFYDQASNLVQTIPPEGVYPLATTAFNSQGNWDGTEPEHVLPSGYLYNTRNQVVKQYTPDADTTRFYYNGKGQLILSQNAKQAQRHLYSFTMYDHLGRILAVGEIDSLKANLNIETAIEDITFPLSATYNPQNSLSQLSITLYDKYTAIPINTNDFVQKNLKNRVSTVIYADAVTDVILKPFPIPDNKDIILKDNYPDLLKGNKHAIVYTYDEIGNVDAIAQLAYEENDCNGNSILELVNNDFESNQQKSNWKSSNPSKVIVAIINYNNSKNLLLYCSKKGTEINTNYVNGGNPVYFNTIPNKKYTFSFRLNNNVTSPQNHIKAQIVNNSGAVLAEIEPRVIGNYAFSYTSHTFQTISIRFQTTVSELEFLSVSFLLDNVLFTEQSEPRENITKIVAYDYDLISGKVNKVTYQPKKPDQFVHRYEYDADNRITDVYTSRDGIIETHDAKYFYYPHGPLARVELGEDVVQGVDYYYTLQGWLKAVNGIDQTFTDPSKDALVGINQNIPQDAFGFKLAYFNNDYQSISGSINDQSLSNTATNPFYSSILVDKYKGLYNGNIAAMATSIKALGDVNGAHHMQYQYDQLNRIVDAYGTMPNMSGAITPTYTANYTYDNNGNILTLNRTALDKNTNQYKAMDELVYHYAYDNEGKLANNKLYQVNDNQTNASLFDADIDDQGIYDANNPNYQYDEIGQLIKDEKENIDSIKWTVYGKIDKIYFKPSANKHNLAFRYDAMGNRIAKLYKNKTTVDATTGDPVQDSTYRITWYWRDAQGNILATETERAPLNSCTTAMPTEAQCQTMPVNEIEYIIYGSSRLGSYHDSLDYNQTILSPFGQYLRQKTLRQYELSNHLGNVLATISDLKYNGGSTYTNHTLAAQDYYPFGMQMIGRTFDACEDANNPSYLIAQRNTYLFGFNGMQKDDEIKGQGNSYDFGARIYDSRLGKWLSKDPRMAKYASLTPYHFANDNPVIYLDPDGEDYIIFSKFISTIAGSPSNLDNGMGGIPNKTTITTNYQILKAPGEDKFFFDTYKSFDDGNNNITTSYETKEFFPNDVDGSYSLKMTKTGNGLFRIWDNDAITLSKIAPKDLSDYLYKKDPMRYAYVKNFKNYAKAVEFGSIAIQLGIGLGELKVMYNAYKARYLKMAYASEVSANVSSSLRTQKQALEHTLGGKSLGTNSYLNSVDDAKGILEAAHKGDAKVLASNPSQNRVYVEYNNIKGYYNNNGTIVETNKFMIKGEKSATVVPIHPETTKFK